MSVQFALATSAMKGDIARLWKLCFGDSDGYIQFYLDHGFIPEQVLVGHEEDELAAMLTMVPVEATTAGRALSGRYIFAVATHPAYQKRGYSTALLDEAHRRLREDGVDFSVLVPASEDLFRFYEKRGYETTFHLDFVRVDAADIADRSMADLRSVKLEDCRDLRDSCFAGSALYCGWRDDMLRLLGAECAFQGGDTLTFYVDGSDGYVVCYPQGDSLIIKECVPPWAAQAILPALHARYGKAHYHLRLQAGPDKGRPFGMCYWYGRPANLAEGGAPYLSLVLD